MTQQEALNSLITFAPGWLHSVEYRLAYDNESKQQDSPRYTIFTMQLINGVNEIFYGPDLQELVSSAKNFIYLTRIEQTLTETPVSIL